MVNQFMSVSNNDSENHSGRGPRSCWDIPQIRTASDDPCPEGVLPGHHEISKLRRLRMRRTSARSSVSKCPKSNSICSKLELSPSKPGQAPRTILVRFYALRAPRIPVWSAPSNFMPKMYSKVTDVFWKCFHMEKDVQPKKRSVQRSEPDSVLWSRGNERFLTWLWQWQNLIW